MKNHTGTVVFNASKNKVFDFISDINNLTTWATGFAREYRFENGKHKVLTPAGEIYFRMESNHESGVIDMWGGPTEEEMAYYPSACLPKALFSNVIDPFGGRIALLAKSFGKVWKPFFKRVSTVLPFKFPRSSPSARHQTRTLPPLVVDLPILFLSPVS